MTGHASSTCSFVSGKFACSALCLAVWMLLGLTARAQQATAQDYEGTFGGIYYATQGITRMVIVVEAVSDIEAKARYVFYPDNSNHNVPSGEFLLTGTVDPKTGQLFLVGKQWVVQPKGYVMVDMRCSFGTDRKTLTGQVFLKDAKEVKFEFKAERWSRMPVN